MSWTEFKKPVNVVGIIIGLFGIALAVYYYYNPQQHREITYRVVSVTKVFDSTTISPKLSLRIPNDGYVTQDVFVASFQFWNTGTEPIEPQDIRKPFSFVLGKGASILDFRISHCLSDESVCKFRLRSNTNSLEGESLSIAWDHLDVGRGAEVQVLYSAAPKWTAGVDGPFTGNGILRDVTKDTPSSKYFLEGLNIFGVLSILFWGMLSAWKIVEWKLISVDRAQKWFTPMFVCLLILTLVELYAVPRIVRLRTTKNLSPFPSDIPVSFKPTEADLQALAKEDEARQKAKREVELISSRQRDTNLLRPLFESANSALDDELQQVAQNLNSELVTDLMPFPDIITSDLILGTIGVANSVYRFRLEVHLNNDSETSFAIYNIDHDDWLILSCHGETAIAQVRQKENVEIPLENSSQLVKDQVRQLITRGKRINR